MEELKKYLETDDSLLIKALAPVKFGPDVNYNQNPESLLRNLLNIDVIQSELSRCVRDESPRCKCVRSRRVWASLFAWKVALRLTLSRK